MSDSRQHEQAVLANTLGFSRDDLESNRSGRLSDAQRTRIADKSSENTRFAWIVTALLLAIGLFGVSVEIVRFGETNGHALTVYVCLNVAVVVVAGALIGRDRRKLRRALAAGGITAIEGAISVTTVRSEKLMVRYFCVGGHRFRIDHHPDYVTLTNLGIDGSDATAFLLTGRHELLSVELR